MAGVLKRPAAAVANVEQEGKPLWYGEADAQKQLEVYLVTAAKLVNDEDEDSDPPLKDPAKITKKQFREALFDSLANPVAAAKRGRPRQKQAELDIYIGVMEGPAKAGHHHAGLKFYNQKHTFLPFKLAMRQRHGIATHWSTTHTQVASVVRYLHKTTEHKKVVDRSPEVWTRDGRKLKLSDLCNEPFQADAWNANREKRVSQPIADKKKKQEKFTHLDFKALVLAESLFTPSAALEYIQEKGTPEMM